MKPSRAALVGLTILIAGAALIASGPVGVYAVLQKVVFEPNEANSERIQLWGAFAFVNGGIASSSGVSSPERGYLYFTMPPSASEAQVKAVRTEWSDLKALAGTGQAIAFGNWGYIGGFDTSGGNEVFVTVQTGPGRFQGIPLRVLDKTPPTIAPAPYITNTGIVRLPAEGSHAAIVKLLKDALKQ